jgi:hypothetical protein
MRHEVMSASTSSPGGFNVLAASSRSPERPSSRHGLERPGETCLVLWDEVDPGRTGAPPAAGAVLFLWPHLRGDLRRPVWSRSADEAEDENAPWWNLEDSKVSAALVLPFYQDLLAFLAEQAGRPRPGLLDRLRAVRSHLRGHPTGQRSGALTAILGGAGLAEELAELAEGAEPGERAACTVAFGARKEAIVHARREERGLWLRLSPAVRRAFDRFAEGAPGGSSLVRRDMDWSVTGQGAPAPRPPEALHT